MLAKFGSTGPSPWPPHVRNFAKSTRQSKIDGALPPPAPAEDVGRQPLRLQRPARLGPEGVRLGAGDRAPAGRGGGLGVVPPPRGGGADLRLAVREPAPEQGRRALAACAGGLDTPRDDTADVTPAGGGLKRPENRPLQT